MNKNSKGYIILVEKKTGIVLNKELEYARNENNLRYFFSDYNEATRYANEFTEIHKGVEIVIYDMEDKVLMKINSQFK